MTKERVIAMLEQMAGELGSQKDLAQQLGIAPSYLSDVMAGKREPGDKIIRQLGLKKVVVYEKGSTTRVTR